MTQEVFVSQADGGKAAQSIVEAIAETGCRVFLADRDLSPGERWATDVRAAIEKSCAVVFLVSKPSSAAAAFEVGVATSLSKPIFIVSSESRKALSFLEGFFLNTAIFCTESSFRSLFPRWLRERPAPHQPAVPIKRSVTADYIVCLEDGKKFKSLKRHLRTRYGMSPEEYREKWGLPHDYPMVAPNYVRGRNTLAKRISADRTAKK
jgi:predicted transcriptional regulator